MQTDLRYSHKKTALALILFLIALTLAGPATLGQSQPSSSIKVAVVNAPQSVCANFVGDQWAEFTCNLKQLATGIYKWLTSMIFGA
jgi:hypothetical protein